MSTKGTAAHVVVSLTHQCPHELQTYTGKILAAFVTGLTDRNPAVRKTYASAIGHLMKTAKDSSVEKLFSKFISKCYFEIYYVIILSFMISNFKI